MSPFDRIMAILLAVIILSGLAWWVFRDRAFTRNWHDWTDRYSRVIAGGATLPCWSAILDGEMIVQDERGVSDYRALRRAMGEEPTLLLRCLRANQTLQAPAPLDQRQRTEIGTVEVKEVEGEEGKPMPPEPMSAIHFSEAFEGLGATIFAAANGMGLEGIVSKRASSRYQSGRSTALQGHRRSSHSAISATFAANMSRTVPGRNRLVRS